MGIPQEIDDYIKESIDYALGLSVSEQTLTSKLMAYEDVLRRLRDRCSVLYDRLKEKDEVIDRARAEASMNAQALKKFVEENQKLSEECSQLCSQCSKWEKECSLYEHDREALMDFANESDQRAREADTRVHDLEEEVRQLSEELQVYKQQSAIHMGDSSEEEQLVGAAVSSLMSRDAFAQNALSLIKRNAEESCQGLLKMWNSLRPSSQTILSLAADVRTLSEDKEQLIERNEEESFQRLLKMWNSLRPSSQTILSLAADVWTLSEDKEQLKINLQNAEEEVKVLFEENNAVGEENRRLIAQRDEGNLPGGLGRSGASPKSNKRKCSATVRSPEMKKNNGFSDSGSPRQVLSPLLCNSSDPIRHSK